MLIVNVKQTKLYALYELDCEKTCTLPNISTKLIFPFFSLLFTLIYYFCNWEKDCVIVLYTHILDMRSLPGKEGMTGLCGFHFLPNEKHWEHGLSQWSYPFKQNQCLILLGFTSFDLWFGFTECIFPKFNFSSFQTFWCFLQDE